MLPQFERFRIDYLTAAVLLWITVGCIPPDGGRVRTAGPPPAPRERSEIVSTIQANAALIDRPLWAGSVTVSAHVRDDQGKSHDYNLEGSLLFAKPRNFRMDLRPGLGEQVMGLGSNNDEYWIWIEPEVHAMRWGRHRFADRPCAQRAGIRVDQLVGALGLGGLPDTSDGLIGAVRRSGQKFDILEYLRLTDNGDMEIDREYWVDRAPPFQIRVVNFRDSMGRITMSAFLDDYQPAWDNGPMVPSAVSMIWPLDDGKFTMRIARIKGMDSEKLAPNAFARPAREKLPKGVTEIIQVDADCK